MLVACLRATRRDRILVLGAVGTVVAIFGAPAFLIVNVVVSDVISEPTGRFGMSLFPVFVIVARVLGANAAPRRWPWRRSRRPSTSRSS